jgi:hypothetical protein
MMGMAFAWVAASGCSFVEHWDADGLACDSRVVDGNTNFCLQGYTCFNQTLTCVRDQSRQQGQACSDVRQCQSTQVCPIDLLDGSGVAQQDDVQTCLRECNGDSAGGGYFQSDACPALYYCSSFLNAPYASSSAGVVGGCVDTSDCTPLTNCNIDNAPGGTCVPISGTANACLTSCNITWDSTAAYKDNCGGAHYCQPLGLSGQQQFVCLNNARNTVDDGAACSFVQAPCANGSVCAPTGICAPYCELIANAAQIVCPTNQVCCPFQDFGSSQASGFCSDKCP